MLHTATTRISQTSGDDFFGRSPTKNLDTLCLLQKLPNVVNRKPEQTQQNVVKSVQYTKLSALSCNSPIFST